jgi:AraC-like DNA-binding protein
LKNPTFLTKMELLYKKIDEKPFSSFYISRVKEPVLDINWHFHKEFELIYIIRGLGIRLVGDNLSSFNSGELVMVGPNLPHLWRTTGNISSVDRIIIKFDELPDKISLFSLPEFSSLRNLFKEAEMGISFGSETENRVRDYILELSSAQGIQKWINLLSILDILSKSTDNETLSNPFMKLSLQDLEENRLAKVITYFSENYNLAITLEDVAKIASMTPQSFCRFFKKRTNKTFIQFLNEYRIGKACVLLIENKLSVQVICDDSGFNSITNFNRFFKRQCNFSPVEFRKKYCTI